MAFNLSPFLQMLVFALVLVLAHVVCVTGQAVFNYVCTDVGDGQVSQPFGITTQTVSNFNIPGSTGPSLSGQYTLARYGANGNWAYAEFQNQGGGVFNPPCTLNQFGDPAYGSRKQCFSTNYAAASAMAAYTDTLHLTLNWDNTVWWYGPLSNGQRWDPYGNPGAVYVVRTGNNGQYQYHRVSGMFWANTDYLGDPLPGAPKQYWVLGHWDTFLSTPTTNQNGNMVSNNAPNGQPYGTWIWCAQEGNTCTYNANGITMQTPTYVRYGVVTGAANTGTIIRLVDTGGSFVCKTDHFYADPAPNVVKACWWWQPNVASQVSMPVGQWKQVAGGGTFGVSWGNSQTYTTTEQHIFSNSLSESIKLGYKGKFLGGEGSVEVTIGSTQTWTTSNQWQNAVTTTTASQCGAPACAGQLYQWSLTAGSQFFTAGGMTVPATVDMCYFACVADLSWPICSPGTCSLTCAQSPTLAADECCVCVNGHTCDFSVCHYQ